VSETRRQLMEFYGDPVQDLQPPRQKAPKLPRTTEEPAAESLESNGSEREIRREQESGLSQVAQLAEFLPSAK
jgi:hypothetical protein